MCCQAVGAVGSHHKHKSTCSEGGLSPFLGLATLAFLEEIRRCLLLLDSIFALCASSD